jgi:hypothetical protein
MLVSLMEGFLWIMPLRWLRHLDIHTKFHKNWVRPSKGNGGGVWHTDTHTHKVIS